MLLTAIGTWTFAGGGLVLEGGRRPGSNGSHESDDVAPLLARLPFPPAWLIDVNYFCRPANLIVVDHLAVHRRGPGFGAGHERHRRSGGVRAAAVTART